MQIRHGDGWTTSYYHLRKIQVRSGQSISRGALLGYTSTKAGCGGYASGPHVHFSVLKNGSHVNLDGLAIGGWTVREGPGPVLRLPRPERVEEVRPRRVGLQQRSNRLRLNVAWALGPMRRATGDCLVAGYSVHR